MVNFLFYVMAGIKKEYLTGFLDCSKIKNVNFSHKTNKKDGQENAVLRRKIWIFPGLFEMQGMLFTIMILGYIFRKVGMISDSGKALLTDLVLYVTLPASILKSFQIEFSHQILVSCL